jgi:tetratricopeptide (TPR) repeat protein
MITDDQLKKKVSILTNKLNAGLFSEVINDAKILLEKRKHQVLFNILSIAYQSSGQNLKSIEVMDLALKANPNNPHFLNNMGISHYKEDNYDKAEYYFKRGLEIEPNYINILNNLGNLKRDLNFTEEAVAFYKKSLSIKSDIPQTLYNLALSYESLGKFDDAKNCLEKILKGNPKFTIADRLISNMTTYNLNNPHYKTMKDKLNDKTLNQEQLSHLYFGLGKYYEDIQDYKNAFTNYSNGNEICKKISKYSIEKDIKKFDEIKNFEYKDLTNNLESKSRKLIFIVGMPRSGTSLVEQILSAHSKVYGGGELAYVGKLIEKKLLNDSKFEKKKINNLINEINKTYLKKISLLNDSELAFTDKAPLNFRYIGFIKHIFPNAKIINCVRDPIDITWSNFKNYFSGSLFFSNDLKDIKKFLKLYEDLMKLWHSQFPNFIYDINYNKLVNNSKEEIQKLLNYLELSWDENCLNHHKNKRSIKTASSTQARKPIYRSALNSSKNFREFLKDN